MTTQPCAKVVGCATCLQVAVVAEVAAQCEHTPGSKRQMLCMCSFDMMQVINSLLLDLDSMADVSCCPGLGQSSQDGSQVDVVHA